MNALTHHPAFGLANSGLIGAGLIIGYSISTAQASALLTLHGADLDLAAPCAQITLTVDSTLNDGLALEGGSRNTARPQSYKDGAGTHLSLNLPNCAQTNRVNLRLSPSTVLTLHDSPHAVITINGTLAALESNLEDATLTLDHVQSLDLSLKGDSHVHILQLDRAAQIVASGNSRLTIDSAGLSVFSGKFSENSQIILSKGQIETLNLVATDHAHIVLTATSKIANIVSNGQSEITLGPVEDTLNHTGTTPIHHADEKTSRTPAQASPPQEKEGDSAASHNSASGMAPASSSTLTPETSHNAPATGQIPPSASPLGESSSTSITHAGSETSDTTPGQKQDRTIQNQKAPDQATRPPMTAPATGQDTSSNKMGDLPSADSTSPASIKKPPVQTDGAAQGLLGTQPATNAENPPS